MKKREKQSGGIRIVIIILMLILLLVIVLLGVFSKDYRIILKNHNQVNAANISSTNEIKVGKLVRYDEKMWVILYDDKENGLQMISVESLKYKDNNFYLGSKDSSIKEWQLLITAADLDNDGKLTNFEKAVYSYNNAIETLNKVCESIVLKNKNIKDVRCVGSNPINKFIENKVLYKTEELEKWPIRDNIYEAGIGNEIAKGEDLNYVSDFERMKELGINETGDVYWMASRLIDKGENFIYFSIRLVSDEGYIDSDYLCHVYKSRVDDENYHARGLRPVVTLKEDIEFISGDGTLENPYVF